MTYQIFQLPKQTLIGTAAIKPSWKVSFFLTGTTTPTPVYTTSALSTTHTQPVQADSGGTLATVYLDPSIVYKASVYDQNDVLQYTVDPVNDSLLSQAVIAGYLYPRTAAEIAAGVTPTDYFYQSGDPRRFGAGPAVAESTNVTAIQAALDTSDFVILADLFPINAALNMNDGNYFLGYGRNTGLDASHAGAVLKGKAVTPSSGTNVRRYHGGGQNFSIYGPGQSSAGSIAIDMRGCSMFKWWNVFVNTIQTAVRQGDNYATFYNEYHAVDISTVTTGYSNDTLGNENLVVGGRVNDCTTGTTDSDNSHNKYIGLALEVFTTGHQVTGAAALQTQYICSRLENAPASGTGFSINSNAQDTQILLPQLIGLTTDFADSGLRTNIIASENWTIAGGTAIKKHQRVTATLNFGSIAAGTTSELAVTITGAATTDTVIVTPPSTLETGLICCGVPSSGQHYVRLGNVTTGAIDPASQTFTIDIWRH